MFGENDFDYVININIFNSVVQKRVSVQILRKLISTKKNLIPLTSISATLVRMANVQQGNEFWCIIIVKGGQRNASAIKISMDHNVTSRKLITI